MEDPPSGGAPEQAPRWDLMGIEGCGGGIRVFSVASMFSGYMDIYRRKEGTGGATWGPSGRGRAPTVVDATCALSVVLKSLVRDFLQKYLSRRFHSVWTPFDILFLQNPEIGKNSNLDWAFGLVG